MLETAIVGTGGCAAGLHDPRVAYWEPAKFVAKLRDHKTDNNMQLFKCDMGAGTPSSPPALLKMFREVSHVRNLLPT